MIIYSTPTCRFCNMAKSYFMNLKIKYTDYDVSKDREKAKEAMEKSGKASVPVIEINGRIITGFNKPLIEDALTRKAPPKREEFVQNIFFDPFDS